MHDPHARITLKVILRYKFLYLLFFPVLVYFIIFHYIPMWGLLLAFIDYKPLLPFFDNQFVGLKHFVTFFQSRDFVIVVGNTLILNIYSILFSFPAPIILALLLNELRNIKFKRVVQTISYLPHFISTVVVVSIIYSVLSPSTGVVASIMRYFGKEPIFFLGRSEFYRPIYILSGIWESVGYGAIIYLAALSGIDRTLYEAAGIDGAGKWKQLLNITLPSLMPTVIVMLILRVGSLMGSDFEKAFLLSNASNRQVSEVISTYVFRRGIERSSYSFSMAVGLFNSLIGFILIVVTNKISQKLGETSLW